MFIFNGRIFRMFNEPGHKNTRIGALSLFRKQCKQCARKQKRVNFRGLEQGSITGRLLHLKLSEQS